MDEETTKAYNAANVRIIGSAANAFAVNEPVTRDPGTGTVSVTNGDITLHIDGVPLGMEHQYIVSAQSLLRRLGRIHRGECTCVGMSHSDECPEWTLPV